MVGVRMRAVRRPTTQATADNAGSNAVGVTGASRGGAAVG